MFRVAAGVRFRSTPRFYSSARSLHTLVVADHNHKTLNPGTLNTISAANKIGTIIPVSSLCR